MKVYLYSRVSTDQQSTQQQERTAYEWLRCHNMEVDEVVSDEGISGGVSFKDRKLGKTLLPKMRAGDMLIVSEVSRLGRSMYDLSKLIHTELKPRKIRLVCVSMGIDLRCDKMTAIDELILNNFSFAAQLEKQLISERTRSALCVKKAQGVKFGAAAEKYKETRSKTNKEVLNKIFMERGELKSKRYLESRDQQAFAKVLRNVFPEYTESSEMKEWIWQSINTRMVFCEKMLKMMKDYQELDADGKLFCKWDFSNESACVIKLRSYLQAFRKSVLK